MMMTIISISFPQTIHECHLLSQKVNSDNNSSLPGLFPGFERQGVIPILLRLMTVSTPAVLLHGELLMKIPRRMTEYWNGQASIETVNH
jgi:hypothetical protein